MSDLIVRIAEQLPALLQAFRKQSGLAQADTAMSLGISQQALSNTSAVPTRSAPTGCWNS